MRIPSTAVLEDWSQQGGRLPQISIECLRLRTILRDLYEEASATEDPNGFILNIIDTFPAEIASWGEKESIQAAVAAELKKSELAELTRLISKYLPPDVAKLLGKYGLEAVLSQGADGSQKANES